MIEPPQTAETPTLRSGDGVEPSLPASGGRSQALDAVRGLALLGVVLVNVEFFHRPFGVAAELFQGGSALENWLRWTLEILVEGKAYPQLAFLFGAGLWLSMAGRRSRGSSRNEIRAFQLTRLVFLSVLGCLHVLLLWYGDILLAYVAIGCLLIWLLDWRPRNLVALGLVVWMMGSLVGSSLVALQALDPAASGRGVGQVEREDSLGSVAGMSEKDTSGNSAEAGTAGAQGAEAGRPFGVFMEALLSGNVETPLDPVWVSSEMRALRDGPFLDALAFRLLNFALSAFSYAVAGIWQLLGIAMVGAATAASGLLLARPKTGAGSLAIATLMALVLNALAWRWLHADSFLVQAGGQWLLLWAGPALAMTYLAWGLRIFRESGRVAAALARLGRVSLSAYLSQSVILAGVMGHWGFALAGRLSEASVLAIAAGVFLAQLVLAEFWLRRFDHGPLEALWRRLEPGG